MGKTKNNRVGLSSLTRARKTKTIKNMNGKRRSRKTDFLENEYEEQGQRYGSESLEDTDFTEKVGGGGAGDEEEENDNRWDFLYNMFSFLF